MFMRCYPLIPIHNSWHYRHYRNTHFTWLGHTFISIPKVLLVWMHIHFAYTAHLNMCLMYSTCHSWRTYLPVLLSAVLVVFFVGEIRVGVWHLNVPAGSRSGALWWRRFGLVSGVDIVDVMIPIVVLVLVAVAISVSVAVIIARICRKPQVIAIIWIGGLCKRVPGNGWGRWS